MICPLNNFSECNGNCGWYNDNEFRCAVLSIAMRLDRIHDILDVIDDSIKATGQL